MLSPSLYSTQVPLFFLCISFYQTSKSHSQWVSTINFSTLIQFFFYSRRYTDPSNIEFFVFFYWGRRTLYPFIPTYVYSMLFDTLFSFPHSHKFEIGSLIDVWRTRKLEYIQETNNSYTAPTVLLPWWPRQTRKVTCSQHSMSKQFLEKSIVVVSKILYCTFDTFPAIGTIWISLVPWWHTFPGLSLPTWWIV